MAPNNTQVSSAWVVVVVVRTPDFSAIEACVAPPVLAAPLLAPPVLAVPLLAPPPLVPAVPAVELGLGSPDGEGSAIDEGERSAAEDGVA